MGQEYILREITFVKSENLGEQINNFVQNKMYTDMDGIKKIVLWKGILFYSPVPQESTFSEELTVSPESPNSSASIESLNSPNSPEKSGSPASSELPVSQESI